MGLELSSPIIASSCGLTAKVKQIEELNNSGVGAIVLKSIFEEQILGEISSLDSGSYAEESEYIYNYVRANSISQYIEFIKESKKVSNVPIIASINCVASSEWVSFAKEIEDAGADALELNIFFLPLNAKESSASIENRYLEVAKTVVDALSIPVSVKLPNAFTNTIHIINELYYRGVKGVVLFNRFYEPDIDVENLRIKNSDILTQEGEGRNLQRIIALATSEIKTVDIVATTGVGSAKDAIKMILAGAKAVEICSILYRKGFSVIGEMNNSITEYMETKSYDSISDFCGVMNKNNFINSHQYMRGQFMKYYSQYEKELTKP